jgi:hypothetical protein
VNFAKDVVVKESSDSDYDDSGKPGDKEPEDWKENENCTCGCDPCLAKGYFRLRLLKTKLLFRNLQSPTETSSFV